MNAHSRGVADAGGEEGAAIGVDEPPAFAVVELVEASLWLEASGEAAAEA